MNNNSIVPSAPEMQQQSLPVLPQKSNKKGKTPKQIASLMIKRAKGFRLRQKHFAFPYALMVAIFVILPLLVMLVSAFRGADGGFTFKNFANLFTEGQDTVNRWKSIGNTAFLAFLTTVVSLAISYPLSLALCMLKVNKSAVLIMLFVAPMWINSLLRLYAIKLVLSGMENKFLLMLIGMVYDFLPFMMLPIFTSLSNTDKSYLEAAGDLGASPLVTLVKVKLPLSVPGIISGVIMTFMPAMSTFAASTILTGGTYNMFGNMIETRMKNNAADGVGSAYSLILLIIMGITFFGANRLNKGKMHSRGEGVV